MADTNLPLVFLLTESSDEEEETEIDAMQAEVIALASMGRGPSRRGSVMGCEIVAQDHPSGDARIRLDYFVDNPVYNAEKFRRRFRMRQHLFLRLVEAVEDVDPYFMQKPNAAGNMGLTALQKAIAAIRILAYGVPTDAADEYVRIEESTARQALIHFCMTVITAFGGTYLRSPNSADVARLLHVGASRGFSGMLGSIDCMHWEWRNCPSAWKGIFIGRGKSPTMILETVASCDLWIWHAYFGMPGSNNDINVLHRSPIFSSHGREDALQVQFTVNGNSYDMGYYLADGIYPAWTTFVKTVRHPMDKKTQHFAAVQEGVRKDIERAFGVLQARWGVVRGPAYGWDKKHI